ncbi:Ribonuclease HI [Chionoecetes opilio]|uniref:ribonuclease H n=1 Tax=Chionoecetes opilio TaxID=41210 RepID=A0A8J5D5R7_CHIOP|nr:Ribonuclease HI [Chionoecetes opilio]
MLQVMDDLTTPASLTIYTDGSVDPATGAAGAAFVSGQTTKQWRLTDGASCLQAELVAIRGTLHHALESHSPHVIIHTDSKSSIQALRDTQSQDNIHLLTSTLLLAQRLAARGCKITLNWVPSHVGLSGNEAADRAAKSAAALPSPTTAVLPSLSQTLLKIKSASHALSRQQHEATVALSSPSPSWYAAATAYHPLPQDTSIPPHVRDRLHRLRLGFPCFEEIRQGDVDINCDHCQVTSPFAFQHYLLKCKATSHLRERLPPHPQPGHPGAAAAAAAVIRSVTLATLTSTVREYPPPR